MDIVCFIRYFFCNVQHSINATEKNLKYFVFFYQTFLKENWQIYKKTKCFIQFNTNKV